MLVASIRGVSAEEERLKHARELVATNRVEVEGDAVFVLDKDVLGVIYGDRCVKRMQQTSKYLTLRVLIV